MEKKGANQRGYQLLASNSNSRQKLNYCRNYVRAIFSFSNSSKIRLLKRSRSLVWSVKVLLNQPEIRLYLPFLIEPNGRPFSSKSIRKWYIQSSKIFLCVCSLVIVEAQLFEGSPEAPRYHIVLISGVFQGSSNCMGLPWCREALTSQVLYGRSVSGYLFCLINFRLNCMYTLLEIDFWFIFKSSKIRLCVPFSDWYGTKTEFHLVPNQLENGKYNMFLVD